VNTKKNKQKYTTNYHAIKQYIELNKKITNADSCNEILSLIELSLDKYAGGGLLNDVCFATSVNCLARHLARNTKEYNNVICDKRFSLLFATLAEALVSENKLQEVSNIYFGSRALANIGWAIAKLGITTPLSQLPIQQSYEVHNKDGDNSDISGVMAASEKRILFYARDIRSKFGHNTRNFDSIQKSSRDKQSNQIPEMELSVLASQILDFIGIKVLTSIEAAMAGDFANADDVMNLQGSANFLWAFATAGRADPKVFESVTLLMKKQVHDRLDSGSNEGLKPQHMSNTLWAVSFIKFFKRIFLFCLVTHCIFVPLFQCPMY
jgi:hypothetical protein